MYVPNKRSSKYVRQKPIKLLGEIDESTIIVGDFNTPLLHTADRKINKDRVELNRAKRPVPKGNNKNRTGSTLAI